MQVEWWPIDRPIPYPKNARKWSSTAVEKVAASIREFGWQQPIVCDSGDTIIIGHLRLAAAHWLQERGELAPAGQVPVHVADLPAPKVRALRLADNRLHEEADWDKDLLRQDLLELQPMALDLSLTGFSANELQALTFMPSDKADECPPVETEAITQAGDLWVMGEHRLLCGDATLTQAMDSLMEHTVADLVFTDPPYGVGYDGGMVAREKLIGDEDTALYDPACKMAAEFSSQEAALYLWHAGVKGIAAAAAAAAAAAGYEIRCEIVWNKNLAQFGSLSAQYKQKHEPCYYCVRGRVAWYGPTNEVTVWDCERARVNEFHPTQKPVAIVRRALVNSSKIGDIVLDLFGGSGSTLIGCEETGRRARLLEIEPRYCDVIVRRWQKFTGRAAILEGDGRTFSEIERER